MAQPHITIINVRKNTVNVLAVSQKSFQLLNFTIRCFILGFLFVCFFHQLFQSCIRFEHVLVHRLLRVFSPRQFISCSSVGCSTFNCVLFVQSRNKTFVSYSKVRSSVYQCVTCICCTLLIYELFSASRTVQNIAQQNIREKIFA